MLNNLCVYIYIYTYKRNIDVHATCYYKYVEEEIYCHLYRFKSFILEINVIKENKKYVTHHS